MTARSGSPDNRSLVMSPAPTRFARKRALVTGGCGDIGAAICRRLHGEGATIVAADLPDQCESTDLRGTDRIAVEPVDVADPASVAQLVAAVRKQHDTLDVLINNAGLMLGMPLLQTDLEAAERLYKVNVHGPLAMIQAFTPLIRGDGAIINMSSRGGVHPRRNLAAYGASKAALVLLSKVAAIELAPIRVNVITPGPIDTAMPRAMLAGLPPEQRQAAIVGLSDSVALGRMGEADEVAAAVAFLASDDASFISGAEVAVDGGRL